MPHYVVVTLVFLGTARASVLEMSASRLQCFQFDKAICFLELEGETSLLIETCGISIFKYIFTFAPTSILSTRDTAFPNDEGIF